MKRSAVVDLEAVKNFAAGNPSCDWRDSCGWSEYSHIPTIMEHWINRAVEAEAENAKLRAVVEAAREWEKCWDRCWECDRICSGTKKLTEALEALEVQE